jgi:hypothetical protein
MRLLEHAESKIIEVFLKLKNQLAHVTISVKGGGQLQLSGGRAHLGIGKPEHMAAR